MNDKEIASKQFFRTEKSIKSISTFVRYHFNWLIMRSVLMGSFCRSALLIAFYFFLIAHISDFSFSLDMFM